VVAASHDYAAARAHWALGAAADVRAFYVAQGFDIDSRLPVRRR
jgi:hypothetical protein